MTDHKPKTFRQDNAFGLLSESKVLPTLQTIHPKFKKTGKYCPIDYILNIKNSKTKKILTELKSRNVKKDTFKTTIIPKNKLDFIQKKPKFKGIFLFNFRDGLFGCNVKDLKLNENYYIDDFVRHKRSDFNDKIKKYLFINTDFLTPFDDIEWF